MKLARQHGAIASVKDGDLLFIRQGQGRTASGKPLPVVTITRKDGDGHRFTLADRGAYTGVIASWLHTREPKKKEVTKVKRRRRKKTAKSKEPEAKQGDYLWWGRMKTCWYLTGPTQTGLMLNGRERCSGNGCSAGWLHSRCSSHKAGPNSIRKCRFKQPIDDAEWTITTLTQTIGPDNGFVSSLELEVKIDDLEME